MSETLSIESTGEASFDEASSGETVVTATMAPPGFVHLSVHSEYSIADGLADVDSIAARAAAAGMPAVALTDRGNLFAVVKFQTACRAAGIKPIIGAELTYDEHYRCIVLVTSQAGYHNLLTLVSDAYRQGEHHGSVTAEQIFDRAEGLIVLLGAASDLGRRLATGPEDAEQCLRTWRAAFDDRLYLEVMRTGRHGEEEFVLQAHEFAAGHGLPLVATNEARFLASEDFEAHETRVCIQDRRVLNDPRRERRYSEDQYLKSPAQMAELFADLPEALVNTVEIAKRCNHEIALGTYYLPEFPLPDDASLESHLEQCSREGLERYLSGRDDLGEYTAKDYHDRLQYELEVVNGMGFAGYFLIVQEFVNWAKEHDIPVGPGRGSGGASLVAFSLGITDLDPLAYGLLFERLLNPERVSMPDFDIDFCMVGRDKVINHVAERYGQDAVGQIVTFGTMAAKAVVRDVARVQGKPFGLADRLAKMIPFEVNIKLADAVKRDPEFQAFIEESTEAAEIMDMAYQLEGVVRNVGRHAGGVVIAPTTLTDYVPVYADQGGGGVLSQYDLNDVEQAGLVKFDFLGLKTLTIIDWSARAINAAREARGEAAIDMATLPLDDAETYEFIKTGETTAIFQLESEGMKSLIRRLQPDSLADIIALVALFRPGPLDNGADDEYVDRKHGREPVSYLHPKLEDELSSTYGVMLYQEQVMTIAQVLAGFSLGEADLLRRAMGKKKPEEMAKMRQQFLDGTNARDVDEKIANQIFDQMETFAGYAFNKAHSAGYALLTYQTAWLKTHYPAEFMAAALSADMQTIDNVVALIDEVRRMGIEVLPPNVNTSTFRFRAEDGAILYGLGAVRGVGEGPVESIVSEREGGEPFTTLDDFCRRVDPKRTNKRVVEALIRSGAMDCFASPEEDVDAVRARLLMEFPAAVRGAEQLAHNASMGMTDMFGVAATAETRQHVDVRPLTKHERWHGEKDALGLYLTGHPIDAYLDEIRRISPRRIAELTPSRQSGPGRQNGQGKQRAAGLVVSSRRRSGQRGDMAIVLLDDRSGRIEATIFGDTFKEHRDKLTKDAVLVIEGDVQLDDRTGKPKIRADRVLTMDEARNSLKPSLTLNLDAFDAQISASLREALEPYRQKDGCKVDILYKAARMTLGDAWRITPSDELLQKLREVFGEEGVVVSYGS